MYKAVISLFCGLLICVGSAHAQVEIPLENLINTSRPDYTLLPLEIVPLMKQAYEADRGPNIDLELAIELYGVVANNTTLDPSIRTFCLANMAYCMERTNRYTEAVRALDQIRTLNTEANEVSFWTEYEIARAMADTGGHSLIPDFNPTDQEKKVRFDALFGRHRDPRMELIAAHMKAAQEYRLAGQNNGEYFAYAVEELNAALALVEVLVEQGTYTKSDQEREAEQANITQLLDFVKFLQSEHEAKGAKTLDSAVEDVFASLASPVTNEKVANSLPEQTPVNPVSRSADRTQVGDTRVAPNRNFLTKGLGLVLVFIGIGALTIKVKGLKK